MDRVFRSTRVLTPSGVRPASVQVRDGVIARVSGHGDVPAGADLVDVGDRALLPGLVDTHVHVNDPGRSHWEGWASATRAAAAGGVTTIVDMPLNSVPATVDVAGLEAKRAAASGRCWVDVGTWGGVVPGNAGHLEALHDAGVPGFKCFLVPSGVDEFPHVGEADLREALPVIARLGSVLLVHAEVPGPIEAAERARAGRRASPRDYATFLASRPAEAETEAARLLARLCRDTGARVHVVHHACADALEPLHEARAQGLPLTVETCPHYLTFEAGSVPEAATSFKCCPPIREDRHRDALWEALLDGTIDFVVTDHSPCPPSMKEAETGDFLAAWGGISSLQLGLRVTWTGARARGIPWERVVRWMSEAPARLAGLDGRKGAIAPGHDADLVVFDPEARATVRGRDLEHRHHVTPYDGRELHGAVLATYLRGRPVYERGSFSPAPAGVLLSRGRG